MYPMTYNKVVWRQITNEQLLPSDMWSRYNPNEIERQGETDFNLQMQAVPPTCYGITRNNSIAVSCASGGYWRPIGLVAMEMLLVARKKDVADATPTHSVSSTDWNQ